MRLILEIWVGPKELRGVRFHSGVDDITQAMTRYVEQCIRDYPSRELLRDGLEILSEAQSVAASRVLTWRPTRRPVRFPVELLDLKVRALSRASDASVIAVDVSTVVEWEFFAHCLDVEDF